MYLPLMSLIAVIHLLEAGVIGRYCVEFTRHKKLNGASERENLMRLTNFKSIDKIT
jgi:hypothetical protein